MKSQIGGSSVQEEGIKAEEHIHKQIHYTYTHTHSKKQNILFIFVYYYVVKFLILLEP